MKVILIKFVPNLGQTGDIKEVSEGYARNYLMPQGLVKIASEKALKELESLKVRKLNAVANKGKKFKEIARKLNNIKIIIKVKADEKKTLFGSVNVQKIVEELKNRNYNVEPKYIKLDQPIKALGYYDVNLDFGAGVNAKIGLTVTRED
ncbi:MAG: 50S ribosomal protein L9 [Candidatus Parcubacteria bacterium]|nr:50S ribosomal protein L9 [Candidatus Parcubacteria bacterium]